MKKGIEQLKNSENIEPVKAEAANLVSLELKANLNQQQREYLKVLKDKMKKILGNHTARQLARSGDLETLKKYNEILDEILKFLRTKEMKESQAEKRKDYERKTIKLLKELKSDYGLDESTLIRCLAGIDSEEAWEIRNTYLRSGNSDTAKLDAIQNSLIGIDSEEAWTLRKVVFPGLSYCVSLAGLDSDRAWAARKELFDQVDLKRYLVTLSGLDSDKAWQERKKFLNEKEANIIIKGMAGLDSPQAWEFRDEYYNAYPDSVAASLAGLDSDRAWDMREELGTTITDDTMLGSLVGLDSERAWEIRENYLKQLPQNKTQIKKITYGVLNSLAGVNSPKAWQWREIAKKKPGHISNSDRDALARSLTVNSYQIGVIKNAV